MILLFILVEHVNAQDSLQIALGKTVRITTPYYIKDNLMHRCNDKLVGTIIKLDKKSVIIVSKERKSDSTKILAEHIKKIELSISQTKKTIEVGFGGLIIGALGCVLLSSIWSESNSEYFKESNVEKSSVVIFGTVAGGLVGGIVGGIIGSHTYKDRWQEVPLEQLQQENLLAQGKGLKYYITVNF
jgi:hypothetical protein